MKQALCDLAAEAYALLPPEFMSIWAKLGGIVRMVGFPVPSPDQMVLLVQAQIQAADDQDLRLLALNTATWLQQAVALDDAARDNGSRPGDTGQDRTSQPGEGVVSGHDGIGEVGAEAPPDAALDPDAPTAASALAGLETEIQDGEISQWLARITPIQEMAEGSSTAGELPAPAAKPVKRAETGVAPARPRRRRADHGPALDAAPA